MFTVGSLFDGSGGFPLAAFMCGGVPVWASEIEPYPIAVTRSRFPFVKHLGSVTDIKGNEIDPVDVITFGSPCQDLSVAGKRAGLKHEGNGDDETTRSGLFMEAVRIAKEMREATGGKYPRVLFWENVPGAFSSNKGEDFRVVCEELIKIVEPSAVMPPVPKAGWAYADSYMGDGWSLSYRVLDAQYWGVPQRRKRIFLIIDLGGERAEEILFKRDGLRGYFEAGRSPWQGVTGNAADSVGATDCENVGVNVAYGWPLGFRPENVRVYEETATTLCNGTRPGFTNGVIQPAYVGSFLPQKKAESMAWSTEDVSCTLHNGACAGFQNGVVLSTVDSHILDDQGGSQISVRDDGKSPTLRAEMHGNIPCVMEAAGFKELNSAKARSDAYGHETAPCLSANKHDASVCVSYTNPMVFKADDGSTGNAAPTLVGDHNNRVTDHTALIVEPIHSDIVYAVDQGGGKSAANVSHNLTPTLTCTHGGEPAVAYGIGNGQANQSVMEERTGALNCMHDQQAVCYGVDCRNFTEYPELNGALQAKPGGGTSLNYNQVVRTQYIVRRLTPTECARLQGFPDDWGHPDKKTEFTDEEYRFWLNVRNTHAEINGKPTKDYNQKQMLTWYNKLHTDSSEYKMWGNGIALPCALYVMQGIAEVFQ